MKSSSNYHCTSLPTKQLSQASQVGHTTLVGHGGTQISMGSCTLSFPKLQQDSGYEFWLPKQTSLTSPDNSSTESLNCNVCTIFFRGLFLSNNESLVSPLEERGSSSISKNSANWTTSRCGISPLNAPDFLCEQRHKSQDKCLPYILFRLFKC